MPGVERRVDWDGVFGRIDLDSRKTVIVAVSGGSDSTALLTGARCWLSRHFPNKNIVAVTVDHGLRTEAAAEAVKVSELCGRLGIEHRTMRWQGEKPETGIAAAAREARYRLLAEAAEESRTDLVLTGHTADDQAETVRMRMERGTGPGLAGMARATLFDGRIWVARPLLVHTRSELRTFLRQSDIEWIDDPSNTDTGFERVRVRKELDAAGQRDEILQLARRWARFRIAMADAVAATIRKHALLVAPGLVRLEPFFFEDGDTPTEALRVLLACSGGTSHLPGVAETRALRQGLERGRAALSRTLVTARKDGIYLHRERREERLEFCDGIFDGRYRIDRGIAKQGWQLAARSAVEPDEDGGATNGELPAMLARAALASEPVLVRTRNGNIGRKKPEIRRYLAPFDHFLAGFDLAMAKAAASLYHRADYPDPPLEEETCATF